MLKNMVDETNIPDMDYGIQVAVRKWIRKNYFFLEVLNNDKILFNEKTPSIK